MAGGAGYRKRIAKGLTEAYGVADAATVELSDLRVIAFSDHHRGKGDGADDFRRCKEAYCAALDWYHKRDYGLWLLGDVEELWEARPLQVMEHYKDVLAAESRFGDRLWRFYGNHDMAWKREKNVEKFLKDFYSGQPMREGLKLTVTDDRKPLGTLFLVHGHQGTIDSGNALVVPFSRFAVRVFWATAQRIFKFASTKPSNSTELRHDHDVAMAAWADAHPERIVLVAGHTHHPVFPGQPPDEPQPDYVPPPQPRPTYFNTGCCSFGDGDVTGIEFADGNVRLVRWLDDEGRAQPQPLTDPRSLRELFESVSGQRPDPVVPVGT